MNNLDLIRELYAAFAQGNVPAVLAPLDPQIDWKEADRFPYGGRYTGPQEVRNRVFVPLATEWEGYRADPDQFLDAGDAIVVLGWYGGTYRKTGKSFRARFAHVWWLKDGRAVRFEQHTDTALVLEAMRT
jgi:uncharacterized protein